ncbi:MAG TPA: hypothetical protein QF604_03760 [Candidatus Latescibacteria bacterium]|jgi:hypothetical protein|nr:hypothetical protein [Gemmatimonadaceae bacterium]MBU08138.1 hypothetical protein [Gemmatimonadota bacterium]HCV23020.1 hypothetical protein [Candidatus Latescibacterota bacterium]HJN27011.1 hypothetical protein [Candidatus Latescibacterota bacterium]
MNLWMDVMRDLESVMDDHERILDGWAEGGVDGVVFGPLVFGTNRLLQGAKAIESGQVVADAYDPNPAVYKRMGVEAPAAPEHKLPEKRALLEKTMVAAKDRGMEVYIMYADSGAGPGGDGYYMNDEKTIRSRVARMVDVLEHFPMADGAVMDGPEWGYEIAPHHMNYRSYFFNDLPEALAPMAADLSYDYGAMVAGKDRLLELFHSFDPDRIRLHAKGGLVGTYQLFGSDPDVMAWLAFRVESLTGYFRQIREGLADGLDRKVKLGCGPRSAAFAPLCGYDFAQLAQFMDFLLPKHYFFHRGFDGFIGTVHRYCETLCEWNPKLEVADALSVVEALFGIVMPGVEDMVGFESALNPEFFEQVVTLETKRALAAVDDPNRIVPWLDTGRFPHDGDPMSARDLQMLLDTAEAAGLQRFNYHHQGNLSPGEWVVISNKCGTRWDPRTSAYEPPDELVL